MFSVANVRDLQALSAALSERCRLAVTLLAETDSTNLQLLNTPEAQQSAEPVVLMALRQSAGRGRMGRRWETTANALSEADRADQANIEQLAPAFLGSFAALSPLSPAQLATLPLHVGVALAAYLNTIGCPARVKWPNDLVLADWAKLGGILIETRSSSRGVWVVIGVGVNWHSAPALGDRSTAAVTQHLPNIATPPDNLAGAAGLIAAIERAWQRVHAGAALDFAAYDILHGARLSRVSNTGQPTIQGTGCGVNALGELGLMSETPGAAITWVRSGEVRMLPAISR